MEERQRSESGDCEKMAVAIRTFQESRDLELMKAAERMEIFLVWWAR